ncbi:hypothetical protein ACM41_13275 [Bradyrhizobium sp. CCBAU 21362]|nr:hypothetical protein [Bradyrhizobium sp. CCBAU 21362]
MLAAIHGIGAILHATWNAGAGDDLQSATSYLITDDDFWCDKKAFFCHDCRQSKIVVIIPRARSDVF